MAKGEHDAAEEVLNSLQSKEPDVTAIKEIFLAQIYLSKQQITKFKNQISIVKKYESMYSHNADVTQI